MLTPYNKFVGPVYTHINMLSPFFTRYTMYPCKFHPNESSGMNIKVWATLKVVNERLYY